VRRRNNKEGIRGRRMKNEEEGRKMRKD